MNTNEDYCHFSISRSWRLIDSSAMANGDMPKVWDRDKHCWIEFDGTIGEMIDAIPITEKEADVFMLANKAPERVTGWIERDVEMPDPWD